MATKNARAIPRRPPGNTFFFKWKQKICFLNLIFYANGGKKFSKKGLILKFCPYFNFSMVRWAHPAQNFFLNLLYKKKGQKKNLIFCYFLVIFSSFFQEKAQKMGPKTLIQGKKYVQSHFISVEMTSHPKNKKIKNKSFFGPKLLLAPQNTTAK